MNEPEIIMNLWYVTCNDGLIYSLCAKPYVMAGTDEEKLAFLQDRAVLDYLIAQPFSVPKSFHTAIDGHDKMAVFPLVAPQTHGVPVAVTELFEEAFRKVEAGFPSQSNMRIPDDPLLCITPLIGDENGNIRPRIDARTRIT